MTRKFITTGEFERAWKEMDLTDEDLAGVQYAILLDPEAGALVKGTGGLRKLRIPLEGRGKSGGARVCYVDFVVKETIYLITAYPKNEKENLSKTERNEIKKLIDRLEKTL